jgi:hypothetical protein
LRVVHQEPRELPFFQAYEIGGFEVMIAMLKELADSARTKHKGYILKQNSPSAHAKSINTNAPPRAQPEFPAKTNKLLNG